MSKLPAVVQTITRVFVCAGVAALAGCGSAQEQADKAAKADVAKADVQRSAAHDLDALNGIQATFDTLANNHALSPQMQVLLRGRQSELRLERIGLMNSDLRAQELVITRDIDQINQLAMQIAGSQATVEALKSYDPGVSISKLTAQRDLIQGSASQLTWMMPNPTAADPNAKITSPTLFAVTQEITDLTNKIQQNQADADASHKLSSSKGDEAESYLRRAEGETGEQNVSDTGQSATDRRDAAYADSHVGTLTNDLARLQANLDRAKDQQTALAAAVKTLNDQIQAQQTRWDSVQAQIKDQQQIQQKLINGGDSSSLAIAALAQDLAQNLTAANDLREKINNDINTVVPQLQQAITLCNQLRQDWVTNVRERQDDPDAVIWKQAQETLHPMYFNLQVALALEARASIAAGKARIDQMIYNMYGGNQVSAADVAARFKSLAIAKADGPIKIPGITELLKKEHTGIDMPSAFSNVPVPDSDALKQNQDDVNKAFQETVDTFEKKFGSIDSGPAADERKNLALAGESHADREWSEFSTFIGDDTAAKNYLQAAKDAEAQIDPAFTLAANSVSNTATPGQAAAAGQPGLAPRQPGVQ